MNKQLVISICILGFSALAEAKGGTVTVRQHVTKDGTFVPEHVRTAPNDTRDDNWSTKGNTNPYTGKEGTKNPDDKN
jgi:hypothetical protein